MTAKDLIDRLKLFNPNAEVEVQCWGFFYPVTNVTPLECDKDNGIVIHVNEVEDAS